MKMSWEEESDELRQQLAAAKRETEVVRAVFEQESIRLRRALLRIATGKAETLDKAERIAQRALERAP